MKSPWCHISVGSFQAIDILLAGTIYDRYSKLSPGMGYFRMGVGWVGWWVDPPREVVHGWVFEKKKSGWGFGAGGGGHEVKLCLRPLSLLLDNVEFTINDTHICTPELRALVLWHGGEAN